MPQITLDELNRMDRKVFAAELGDIFEHSPWIAEAAYDSRPFSNLQTLYQALTDTVRRADAARQTALIAAHPDLAGKAAREGAITADSKMEQASAGLDRLSNEEFEKFHKLNDAYRAKFGIPFIVCARRHGKDSILRQFERRLGNDEPAEHGTTLNEIFHIAALRLDQRVFAPDRLKVRGQLSTHVLDASRGSPAVGVRIDLFEISSSGAAARTASARTNVDGRTDKPLIADRPLPIAEYELRFHIGGYFADSGTPVADPPFLGIVPIRFAVAEPEANYHVPLLVTPWSYSTYRGS